MDTETIQNLIQQAMDERETKNAYGVSKVSYHTHNGTDSPAIASVATIAARSAGSSVTSIPSKTTTKITLNTNTFAQGVTWDIVNHRLIIITAGYYQVNGQLTWSDVTNGFLYSFYIYKNNAPVTYGFFQGGSDTTYGQTISLSDVLSLKTGDYLELFCYQDSAGANNIYGAYPEITFLSITKV
jgi:hypothetical protein